MKDPSSFTSQNDIYSPCSKTRDMFVEPSPPFVVFAKNFDIDPK